MLTVSSTPLAFDRSIAKEIQILLRKSHKPRVRVERSTIPGAGAGVYAQQPLLTGQVACVYPGVYTPPLPNSPVVDGVEYVYLADQRTPSGLLVEENAYILNLQDVRGGGYLDGRACKVVLEEEEDLQKDETSIVWLDKNPSACGHLVNHNSGSKANIAVLSFLWQDVFRLLPSSSGWHERDNNNCDDDYYGIPNRTRVDGSPWYFDPLEERIVYFRKSQDDSSHDTVREPVCGAAMVVLEPIAEGEELFLDYGLTKPYPGWAKDWYSM